MLFISTIAAVVLVGCGSVPKDIWEAAKQGDVEAVKQFIAADSDVNAKDGYGVTPLYHAAGHSHKEIVELLIANGADVNTNDSGGTPLHHAVTKEIAELLIAKGADVNAKADNGLTPLNMSIERHLTEITTLLRKHGGKTGEELKAEGK